MMIKAVQQFMLGNVLNSEKQAKLRSGTMLLNGKELVLGENDMLPELVGMKTSGQVEIDPGGCTFFVIYTHHYRKRQRTQERQGA